MAYIKLKIDNKEVELRGSEEFLSKMENKIFQFIEKNAGVSRATASSFPAIDLMQADLQTSNSSSYEMGVSNNSNHNEYVRDFMEKYNNFNTNIGKTSF